MVRLEDEIDNALAGREVDEDLPVIQQDKDVDVEGLPS